MIFPLRETETTKLSPSTPMLSSPTSHLSRRALLKGLLLTAGGGAVMNWGG